MFLIPEFAIERWLFHDGLSVNDSRLVALAPAVEKATGIRDRLLEELAASGLDADRALDRALNEAAEAFRSQPPDSNESTTKVRIALETAAPCWEARAGASGDAMRISRKADAKAVLRSGLDARTGRAVSARSCNMRATRNAVHARPLKLPPRQILELLEAAVPSPSFDNSLGGRVDSCA